MRDPHFDCTPNVTFRLALSNSFKNSTRKFVHVLLKRELGYVLYYLIIVVTSDRLAHSLDERSVTLQRRIERLWLNCSKSIENTEYNLHAWVELTLRRWIQVQGFQLLPPRESTELLILLLPRQRLCGTANVGVVICCHSALLARNKSGLSTQRP